VEVLRKSIEHLAVPICERCNGKMAWSRSTLMAAEHVVERVFSCARCGSFQETLTPASSLKVRPVLASLTPCSIFQGSVGNRTEVL
jgi:hypothetical protein